ITPPTPPPRLLGGKGTSSALAARTVMFVVHLASPAHHAGGKMAEDRHRHPGAHVSDSYDVVILGGGSGGYATAPRAAQPGRLVAPDTVEVDGDRLTGRNVVLATGSFSKTLPGLEVDGEQVITSEHALDLDRVPESVVVLGGGVIGCEFASAWRSFGAEVVIL